MKSPAGHRRSARKNLHSARKLAHAVRAAAINSRKTGELTTATGKVVAKRVSLGVAATIDPRKADAVEFARIVPEKLVAFSQANLTSLWYSGEAAQRVASYAASEMASMAAAAVAIGRCLTPGGVIAAQSSFAAAWFARALSQSITLAALAVRSQGAAMAPIHRTATANARRLSR